MKYMKFKNVMIFILSLITVWIVVVFFCYKGYFINIEVGHLTSSSCHPKIFVKEFSYFLMSCH